MYLTDIHGRVVVRWWFSAIWHSVSVSTAYMQNRCLFFGQNEFKEKVLHFRKLLSHIFTFHWRVAQKKVK